MCLKTRTFWVKSFNICEEELVTWVWNLWFPLYELYWLLTTRHLTANIFSCTPIFLDNDFCKTINLFIIDICACSVYLEEKAPVENKQTSINKNNHVNMEPASAPSVLGFPSVTWLEGDHTPEPCTPGWGLLETANGHLFPVFGHLKAGNNVEVCGPVTEDQTRLEHF